MTTTVSKAVAERDQKAGIGDTIAQYETSFAAVLPEHVKPATFVRLAQSVLRRDPDLARAAQQNPASLLATLLECARLGHEPGTDAFALVAFEVTDRETRTKRPEIVGIEQYQGEIERMYRAGAVTSVKCEVVRGNDDFRWAPTRMRTPHHEFDALADDKTRGPLVGVYAYAETTGGALSQVVVMGKGEVMKHKAAAKTKKFWEGPWEPAMWRKTAIHELEKWVPTSSEYLRQRLEAAAEANRVRGEVAELPPPGVDTDGVIHDAEIVGDGEQAAEAEQKAATDG